MSEDEYICPDGSKWKMFNRRCCICFKSRHRQNMSKLPKNEEIRKKWAVIFGQHFEEVIEKFKFPFVCKEHLMRTEKRRIIGLRTQVFDNITLIERCAEINLDENNKQVFLDHDFGSYFVSEPEPIVTNGNSKIYRKIVEKRIRKRNPRKKQVQKFKSMTEESKQVASMPKMA